MSLMRRWGLSAFLLCLGAAALPSGAARAAPENPPAPDAKAADELIRQALKAAVNEGCDMYNAEGRYTEHDYLGCYHLYEGALITIRPMLSSHTDLQKAIDEGLEVARNTPRSEMRAFVLRSVIDQIRDTLKPGGPTLPPPPITEKTTTGKVTKAESLRLTVKGDDGKETVFAVSDDAAVTIDGKPGRVDDIKADSMVTVTAKGSSVTKVEAKSPAATPPPKSAVIQGTVIDVEKNMLTVNVGDKPKVLTIPADAKVFIDGNDAKLTDLKKDSTATITTRDDVVVTVDAKSPAAPPPPAETKTEGKVTKVDGGKITIKPAIGESKDFTVPDAVKVVIDGKDAKLSDVKPDSVVTITTDKDGKVTKVEAKAPAAPPPPALETKTSGKVIKIDGGKISVLPPTGEAKDFTIPESAKITLDGKDAKLSDVKADATVTITDVDGKVTKVEVKAPAAPPSGQTLWERLGGEKGVAKVVDDFVNAAAADPKVNFYRDPLNKPSAEQVAALKTKLVEFVSSATGGPLKYTGKDMKEVHKGMKITDAEFDACEADLKAAMERNGVKADDEKALLDAVEGTRKDVVEVKSTDKPKPPE